ncbi:hypothetical protein LOTGIDRAFT_186232 [Lottia gigantea]|uniref:Protein N-terminal asparagine amidohydrolase n=1 Tax=Lottia gigantea TaxID=225164 RepID=V4AVR3_LOTGI|nr:hypothetical protein LOTGIDRAFT_186232 [Lottia gigantea]ESP01448.1 hypothetical protein LOTGIDRAFT_186232 [Lottia gigantea]
MPLYAVGSRVGFVPSTIGLFLESYPSFQESAKSLCASQTQNVNGHGLLYVGQREFAGTSPTDDVINVIGSEDATTCHLAVFRHTGSGSVCVSHFDGCGTEQGIKDMISLLLDLSKGAQEGKIEIHLLGGFKDSRNLSQKLSLEILNCLCRLEEDVHLVTACITDLNTTYINGTPFPVIYGIAVNVNTGEIYKARFTDKGPDQPLRSARHFTGGHEMLNIYDPINKQLSIGPFSYTSQQNVDYYCRLPNHVIRKHLSTSPEQEPEGFEDSVRAAFIQIRDYPNPMKSHFSHGGARRYKKQPDGTWILVS